MKILYFVTKSELGGVSIYISQLYQYLKEEGNEIAIMAHPGGWLETRAKKLGIKFYPNDYLVNSLNPIKGIMAKKLLRQAIIDFKPDVVHCNSSVAGYWGRSAIKNAIPTVFTAHGWAFTDGAIWWRKIVGIISERLVSRYCFKIICVSENDRRLALKYKIASASKLITIHNGIDIQNWETICEQKNAIAQRRGTVELNKIKILFVGRLAMPKDPTLLVRTFAGLSEEVRDKSEIYIVGDGPDKNALENLIASLNLQTKVFVLGELDREALRNQYLASDISVLTTRYEGFPYTIIEAMSYGLPVIVSNVGGCREAVDSNCGFLVKRGDVKGVEDALVKLITNKDLREKMGKTGYEKAAREFSLNRMLEETEKVYEGAILNKNLKFKQTRGEVTTNVQKGSEYASIQNLNRLNTTSNGVLMHIQFAIAFAIIRIC